jgi:hypothetical protein
MSVSLASTAVSAAICPNLSVNLLSRTRAAFHDILDDTPHVELPITVSYLNQERTTSFPFVVVDRHFGFEILLGRQWDVWCMQHKG